MQNDLPPLPEMKPIPAASHAPIERPTPAMPYGAYPALPFGQRVRGMFAAFAGMGFGLMIGVVTLEVTMPVEWQPTTLAAMLEATIDMKVKNQLLGAKPGEMTLTEADYKQRIARAERSGQADAELAFQKKLAVVQTDKERVVQAYATLFQRANLIAQAAIQLETLAQQFRQQLLQMSNGGRSMVVMMKDLFCGFTGDPSACESAKADRRVMIDESDELSRGDVGKRVRELMAGVDDPASLTVHRDQQRTPTFGMDEAQP